MEKWEMERMLKEWNPHCIAVCDMVRGKYSSREATNRAYHDEIDRRMAHTGWKSLEILDAIFDRASRVSQ